MTTRKSSDKGYTVAEAAEKLGVPKKNLRHALARPDRKARLLREYRNTKKGLVSVEIVPDDLLLEIEKTAAQYGPRANVASEAPADSISILVIDGDPSFDAQPEPDDAAALDLERVLAVGLSALVAPPEAFSDDIEYGIPADKPVDSEPVSEPEVVVATMVPEPDQIEEPEAEAKAEPLPAPEAPAPIAMSEPLNVSVATEPTHELRQAPSAADTLLVVATYERLLAEKEGRIADMRNALEAERENSRRLADALSREQALRAEAKDAPKRGWWARLFGG